MAEEKIRGQLHHSRHSHQFRGINAWTKMWDPNKQLQRERNDNSVLEKETGGFEEREEESDYGHKKCCGGNPCKRRTQDEFGNEMSAISEGDSNVRNQNRSFSNKYKLPLSLVENLRDVFIKFDEDNDGTVSGKEILDVFQTLGAVFTRQQCDDVIKSFLGGNISGEIDFEEMIKMFAHRKSNAKDYQQDLELAFKMFDLDGDGYVCAEDLKQVMKMLGNDLSDEEIRTIYSHLDTDDNGLIDFSEFESILYPDVRQNPIMKKKRTKSPQRKTHNEKNTTQKKATPKTEVAKSGVVTVRTLRLDTQVGGGSSIYNAFYSDHAEGPGGRGRGSERHSSKASLFRTQNSTNKQITTIKTTINNKHQGKSRPMVKQGHPQDTEIGHPSGRRKQHLQRLLQ